MEIVKLIVLGLSGLMLTLIGLMRLTNPIKTYAKNSGITLPSDTDLLNEIRGIGALMLCGGIVITIGIFLPNITTSSFVVGTLIFIGFAIGRLYSQSTDGKPNKQLVIGVWSEIILGAANAFCLFNILL